MILLFILSLYIYIYILIYTVCASFPFSLIDCDNHEPRDQSQYEALLRRHSPIYPTCKYGFVILYLFMYYYCITTITIYNPSLLIFPPLYNNYLYSPGGDPVHLPSLLQRGGGAPTQPQLAPS